MRWYVIWCDVMWCDMIWYDMIWYDMIWYDICDQCFLMIEYRTLEKSLRSLTLLAEESRRLLSRSAREHELQMPAKASLAKAPTIMGRFDWIVDWKRTSCLLLSFKETFYTPSFKKLHDVTWIDMNQDLDPNLPVHVIFSMFLFQQVRERKNVVESHIAAVDARWVDLNGELQSLMTNFSCW